MIKVFGVFDSRDELPHFVRITETLIQAQEAVQQLAKSTWKIDPVLDNTFLGSEELRPTEYEIWLIDTDGNSTPLERWGVDSDDE